MVVLKKVQQTLWNLKRIGDVALRWFLMTQNRVLSDASGNDVDDWLKGSLLRGANVEFNFWFYVWSQQEAGGVNWLP